MPGLAGNPVLKEKRENVEKKINNYKDALCVPPELPRDARELQVAWEQWLRAGQPVPPARMVELLRQASRSAIVPFGATLRTLADQIEKRQPLTADAGPIVDVVKARLEREPGEDG